MGQVGETKWCVYVLQFVFFLSLMFFINYLHGLYTSDNLFHFNLEKVKKREKEKVRKFFFIVKNDYTFLITVLSIQSIISSFYFLALSGLNFFSNKYKDTIWSVGSSFFTMIIAEIFPRVFSQKTRKRLAMNIFFLNMAFFLAKVGSFVFSFIKPKEKITSYTEEDLIRYVHNLSFDNVVENEEAKLIQAAFEFDDLTMKAIMIPASNVVCVPENATQEEVKIIHSQFLFSYYPVINRKKNIVGIFSGKSVFCLNEEKEEWQKTIKANFLKVSPEQTLDSLLERINNDELKIAIVVKKNKFLGIVSAKDVLGALIGKIEKKNIVSKK